MATHSRTELFRHFRNSYHSHRATGKRLSLPGDEDNLLTMTIRPQHQAVSITAPMDAEWRAWFEAERAVGEELQHIHTCSTTCHFGLVEQSGRVRYQTVFSGGLASHGELSLSDEIVNRLLRLKRMITDLVVVDEQNAMTTRQQIQVNCQLAYFNKLASAAERFQSSQRAILQRMRSDNKKIESIPDSPQSDTTWATNDSPPQSTMFMLEQDLYDIRSQEYDAILHGMRSVAALCQQMHLLVSHHGGLLDRIDYNLENAQQRTQAAVTVIRKRGEVHDLDKRKLVVLFLVVMIIIMATAVILKPKNS